MRFLASISPKLVQVKICKAAHLGKKKKFSSKFHVSFTPSLRNPLLISVLLTWLNPDSQGVISRARLASGHTDTAVNV